MEPGEILSTAAQIAVALAGFAGVVVVFRRESVHDWPPLDKFRLRLLLTNSALPLILCIIGLLLLGVRPVPSGIWRWCSGVAFCFISPWVITAIAVFYRSGLYRSQGAGANFVTYLFRTLGSESHFCSCTTPPCSAHSGRFSLGSLFTLFRRSCSLRG